MNNPPERRLVHNKYYTLNSLMGRPCDINKSTRKGRVLMWLLEKPWTEPEKDRKESATALTRHAKDQGAEYLRFCRFENIKLEQHLVYHGAVCFYIKPI